MMRQGTAAVVLLALSLPVATAAADDGCADSVAVLETALVRLAADRIDGVLGAVADSTKALGDAYARLPLTTIRGRRIGSPGWRVAPHKATPPAFAPGPRS